VASAATLTDNSTYVLTSFTVFASGTPSVATLSANTVKGQVPGVTNCVGRRLRA
jgi:hypothetical protein